MMEATTMTETLQAADQRPQPARVSHDNDFAVGYYATTFDREPVEGHAKRIRACVRNLEVWKRALFLWKSKGADPVNVDGLLDSYWELMRYGIKSEDACRRARLNRVVAMLPDLERTIRYIEELENDDRKYYLKSARELMGIVFCHGRMEAFALNQGKLAAAWLFAISDSYPEPMQILGSLALCNALVETPAILSMTVQDLRVQLL